MLIDAATVPAGTTLQADVCIIGAGPSGLTVASELSATGIHVCIIESGGLAPEKATASLGRGIDTNHTYVAPLAKTRVRAVAGSSHHWNDEGSRWAPDGGMRTLPLTRIDFQEREAFPFSGWPISLADLEGGYRRAREICDLPDDDPIADLPTREPRPFDLNPDRIAPIVFSFAPKARFSELGARLTASAGITVLTHATVAEIELAEDGLAVGRLAISGPEGHRFFASGRTYVLAGGGIDNARLLLASKSVRKEGIGNRHDLVGRFFMDHLHAAVGMIEPSSPQLVGRSAFYQRRPATRGGASWLGGFALADRLRAEEGLLGVSISPFITFAPFFSRGFQALIRLNRAGERELTEIRRDLRPVTSALLRVAAKRYPPQPDTWGLVVQAEQAPDPSNRVTLATAHDRFGGRQARLDWRIGEREVTSISRTLAVLDQELESAGVGRAKRWFGDEELARRLTGSWHQMGTTRMAAGEEAGVVDADCRVFSVANLYVAGSSVFPTGGPASATFTAVALAARLADHIAAQMRPPSVD